ncbi:DUF928 domain-containing protein [Allocoleopsis franciscana]|uniref:DUF928 domain-containing protein n=1 Tax=Allocoleopsis franciscana PCC 7113 TaxID=1173027 RepID=K9WHL3_9CYAN|nr:DUF928 domain-containing protein [Allocoleopsis franciscana]AFZ19668.1 protein of unknown function (DUF928) [Allocoleopsis franciscana PCC 7113]
MINKTSSERQKSSTLSWATSWAFALIVAGAYASIPRQSLATPVQTQSTPVVSTVTPTPVEATPPSCVKLQLAQLEKQQVQRSTPQGDSRPGGDVLAQNPPQNPPKDRGAPAPGQRTGGATRGRCPSASKPLTALVPIISASSDKSQHPVLASTPTGSVLGLTVVSHPTFWFYVPYSITSERPVEFILKDDRDNIIYQTLLSESATAPGVVGFKLPNTVKPLEVNKRYNWFLTIACTPPSSISSDQQEPVKIFVSGWVERVTLDPSLQRELDKATPQQQALLYAKGGIWYEAVTNLAELRRQKPNDVTLKAEWAKLLRSINLEAIASEPITSMLTPKK